MAEEKGGLAQGAARPAKEDVQVAGRRLGDMTVPELEAVAAQIEEHDPATRGAALQMLGKAAGNW